MNIYNQNIGQNYKGILNLDATTINTPLDATLRAVTDGMGTSSLLQLSTEAVGLSRTVNLAAGATNPRLFNEVYTINNSGAQTGTLTGLFLNATETALNGITHNLLDLQVGGVSRFLVANNGGLSLNGTVNAQGNLISGATQDIGFSSRSLLSSPSNGVLTIKNAAGTDFSRLQLGGTTSSFPAIKRNGAAIDFRLADDSGYCNANIGNLNANFCVYEGGRIYLNLTAARLAVQSTGVTIATAESLNNHASSILDIRSTTQGFLMPRMTYAQMKAIGTPATGLQVYNTDNNTPQVYDGTGYQILGTSVVTGTISAGATTLSCDNGNIFALTLVNGTPTAITLSNARPSTFVINLKQPAGGSATVTWSTTIVWAGGSAPTLTTTANYLDIVTLIYDGTTWRGTATLNFAS